MSSLIPKGIHDNSQLNHHQHSRNHETSVSHHHKSHGNHEHSKTDQSSSSRNRSTSEPPRPIFQPVSYYNTTEEHPTRDDNCLNCENEQEIPQQEKNHRTPKPYQQLVISQVRQAQEIFDRQEGYIATTNTVTDNTTRTAETLPS